MRLSSILDILPVFKKYRWHVAALVILGLMSAVLEGIGINALVPLLTFFVGGGEPTDPISSTIFSIFQSLGIPFVFRYLLALIIGLFCLRAFFIMLFSFVRGWVTADFMSAQSEEMLRLTLMARWPYLLRQKLGALQNTAVRDVQQTGSVLVMVVQFIQSMTGFLMYLAVAFTISPPTTLFTLIGGGVLILIVRPLLKRTNRMGEQMAATEKDVVQFLNEHLIGMKTLKASGSERQALKSGHSYVRYLRDLSIRIMGVRALSNGLFQPFSIIFVVIVFAFTYNTPGFNILAFGATLYLIQKIFTYLESGQTSLQGAYEALGYARNLIAMKSELAEHAQVELKGSSPFSFAKEIAFKDVSFSYEKKEVLKDVSFALNRGQTVGFVGSSGAGKTTIADLILRLFEPTGGVITLDGKPVSGFSLQDWRAHVGYVAQEAFLLNATIADNIRFYRDLPDEAVREAARQANILSYIESLPAGFETPVGDRGVLLSGGQRQRVALARALAGKPELLVLDEATSALDGESERLIQESIASLHGNTTVIIIAHRLSTLNAADTIFVLEHGAIAEQGSPEVLRANPNSYLSRHGA